MADSESVKEMAAIVAKCSSLSKPSCENFGDRELPTLEHDAVKGWVGVARVHKRILAASSAKLQEQHADKSATVKSSLGDVRSKCRRISILKFHASLVEAFVGVKNILDSEVKGRMDECASFEVGDERLSEEEKRF